MAQNLHLFARYHHDKVTKMSHVCVQNGLMQKFIFRF